MRLGLDATTIVQKILNGQMTINRVAIEYSAERSSQLVGCCCKLLRLGGSGRKMGRGVSSFGTVWHHPSRGGATLPNSVQKQEESLNNR